MARLSVLPDQREKGFGNELVNHVFTEARGLGATMMTIGSIAHDTTLKTWYRKIGFVEGETKKFSHLPFPVTFLSYEL